MPCIILKANAGMNFETSLGVIPLKGYCELNTISEAQVSELRKNEAFRRMEKRGFIEVSSNASPQDSHKAAQEVMSEQSEKQSRRTKNISKEA